ncbi:LCP family protein [Microbacterium sp. NEAU-LLB]|uniref:LCP family protein n=2 Tax=Microbacterium stercoris TaxID=2820289 RepID=A0A939QL86_9MICO|nr:LCP family protein [Microbacterium stercoris]MBO3664969.1 LCP family protein [Microbacterium stercoris]
MTRRGWWLVVLGWLVPGSAQVLAGNRRLGRFGLGATLWMWTIGVVLVLAVMLWRPGVTSVMFAPVIGPILLTIAQVAAAGYGILWVILGIDTLRLVRLVKTRGWSRVGIAVLSIVLMVISGGTAAYASSSIGAVRDTLGAVFGQSGPPVEPSDGHYNILLLGADSGDGRDSMRFDSISVLSINADTGAVTITGIPRDMRQFPFSEGSPMRELYPNGFEGHGDPACGWDGGINQLRNAAENCRDDKGTGLYPEAAARGSAPGVEATKDAAEGILGIEIPYYVFIDMHGFAALIDALGGVEIEVTERLPEGGGPAYQGQPAQEWATGWIEPGLQRMDGDTAQWYARSRYTTSDWDRMQRQRQLQQAILAQFTPSTVLTRFQDVAKAGSAIVETDLPQSMLSYFVELGLKAKEQPVTTIELVPPLVDPDAPDFEAIRQHLAETLHPTPAPTPGE